MKNILFFSLLITSISFSQSKNISLKAKVKDPYVTLSHDTIKVNDKIVIKEGSNGDGTFKYVQVLNNFNEPLYPADSKAAYKKQPVMFFKEQDETYYIFTKFYCINIEPALKNGEIEIFK